MTTKQANNVVNLAPQEGKQRKAFDTNVDVMIFGGAAGSGKSRLLLIKALKHAYKDPDFEGVMFRRTTGPLRGAGGLFTESKKLFRPLNPRIREKDMEIVFEGTGGGNLKYTHLEHENDAEGNHQGLQYSFVGFDELTHFTQAQFLYLIGRLRSQAEGDSFAMGTCNPDPDSWVYNWVDWYLNSEGYPDQEKDGIVRYFVIVDDRPVFANTEEELAEAYPDICYQDNGDEKIYISPLSFTFISGTIFNNPALIKANPKYLSALKAQSPINRARLLDGNWHARAEGSNYFQRQWLNKLDSIPMGCMEARGWDLASAEPSDKNRYPDYTASIKMLKTEQNTYILVGNYIKESFDEMTRVNGKFRKRPGVRDTWMINQAKHDGIDTAVVLPKDPGQAGAFAFQEMAKMFTNEGFIVHEDPNPSNKSKLKRFEAFSSAAQNGLVSIVEDTFEPATLAAFYKELESFDGERSTADRKDDWPDATASVFAYLAKGVNIVAVPLPTINAPTMISGLSSLNYF